MCKPIITQNRRFQGNISENELQNIFFNEIYLKYGIYIFYVQTYNIYNYNASLFYLKAARQ